MTHQVVIIPLIVPHLALAEEDQEVEVLKDQNDIFLQDPQEEDIEGGAEVEVDRSEL